MSHVGKRALVTGGSRGIGAAIAKVLVAEGADVAFGQITVGLRSLTLPAFSCRAVKSLF